MTIEIIDERHLRQWNRTQCESDVGLMTQRWRDFIGEDNRCKMTALYRLDGVALCARHCGDRLIDRELKREKQ